MLAIMASYYATDAWLLCYGPSANPIGNVNRAAVAQCINGSVHLYDEQLCGHVCRLNNPENVLYRHTATHTEYGINSFNLLLTASETRLQRFGILQTVM